MIQLIQVVGCFRLITSPLHLTGRNLEQNQGGTHRWVEEEKLAQTKRQNYN